MNNGDNDSICNSSTGTNVGALDSSFQLELVGLPVWFRHAEGQPRDSSLFGRDDGLAPQKRPWAAVIIEEIWKTDNIFVTEIGERDLREYLQQGLIPNSNTTSTSSNKNDEKQPPREWELQNAASSFRYLMEILQANMIYFLQRRYFDLERCRDMPPSHHSRQSKNSSIVEDFQTIFDKTCSSRYLTNREHVANICFKKSYHRKGHSGLSPKTIQRALVRLHRRAGIYVPMPIKGRSYHPAPIGQNGLDVGVDAYWIDLWWICSSLLAWILEPCLEITCYTDCSHSHKRRRKMVLPTNSTGDPTVGFPKHQRIIKIPFKLIRSHTQSLGLYYDKVLLHDGPWNEEEDEDWVWMEGNSEIIIDSIASSTSSSNGDDDGDDSSEGSTDESSVTEYNRTTMLATVLANANGSMNQDKIITAEAKVQHQGKGNGSNLEGTQNNAIANQQTGMGTEGIGENDQIMYQHADLTITRVDYEGKDKDIGLLTKAVFDTSWANESENGNALCSNVVDV